MDTRPEISSLLIQLMHRSFGSATHPTSWTAFPEGDFIQSYRVDLNRAPWKAAVKFYKPEPRLAGLTFEPEAQVLRYFKSLGTIPVPDVYYCHKADDEIPGSAIVLEWLEGRPIKELYDGLPPEPRKKLAANFATILLSLHSHRNPRGFGPLDGPWEPDWLTVYRPRIERAYRRMDRSVEIPEMIQAADASYHHLNDILGQPCRQASLLHGDLFWTNILADPASLQIVGLIDPIIDPFWLMPQWGDREYELAGLLFMDHPIGIDIVEQYRGEYPLDDQFPLRRRFYNLWLVLDIWRTIGYHNKKTDKYLACALLDQMHKHNLL